MNIFATMTESETKLRRSKKFERSSQPVDVSHAASWPRLIMRGKNSIPACKRCPFF